MRVLHRSAWGALLILAALGCGPEDGVAADVANIVSATGDDDPTTPQFPEVVDLTDCTGTLITPSHVLTAAHCADDAAPTEVTVATGAARVTVPVVGCWMHNGHTQLYPDRIVAPLLPGETRAQAATRLGDRCGVLMMAPVTGFVPDPRQPLTDVALLQLDHPIPHALRSDLDPVLAGAGAAFVTPTRVVAIDASGMGIAATAVGFGPINFPDSTETPPMGAGTRRFRNLFLTWSSGSIQSPFIVTAPGDSGGPLLASPAGERNVIAVASLSGGGTSEWTGLARSEMRDWIEARIDQDGDSRDDVDCAMPRGSARNATSDNDPDGDYVLTPDDSAPLVYNPCQGTSDADHDGTPDDIDPCPRDASVSSWAGQTDPDGDGLATACDCHPDAPDRGDTDQDLVRDGCDNCPQAANPDQANCDGSANPLGDACQDGDRDGVVDACGRVDNCALRTSGPFALVQNHGQENCNADAELAAWQTDCVVGGVEVCPSEMYMDYVRGDACDPTPCGDTLVGGADTGAATTDFSLVRVDATAATSSFGPFSTPIDALTGMRFCRCELDPSLTDLAQRAACQREVRTPQPGGLPDVVIGGCGPIAIAEYRQAAEPQSWRWMTTTFETITSPLAPAGGVSGLHVEAPTRHTLEDPVQFTEDLAGHWDFEGSDVPRWRSDFSEPIDRGLLGQLPGVVMTRQPTLADGGAPTWDERLATHLETSVLQFRVAETPPGPGLIGLPFPYPFGEQICTFCDASFPRPWIGVFVDGATSGTPTFTIGGRMFSMTSVGAPALPRPGFEPTWVSAVEPLSLIPADGPRLALLAPGNVVDSVFAQRGNIMIDLIKAQCPPEQCGPGPFSLASGADDGPPDRTGEVRVLASTLGRLFVIGGFAPDGTPLHDVWTYDVGTDTWSELPTYGVLGTVLAATFDAASGDLIVLDEVASGPHDRHGRQARLLRIGRTDQDIGLLASFSRIAGTDRFAMAVDVGGTLWLAASPAVGRTHIVVELARTPSGGLDPRRAVAGVGRVYAGDALRAEPLGLTLLVEDRARGFLPLGYRYSALGRPRGMIDRCF